MKVDYGPMALHEKNAQKGDLFTIKESAYAQTQVESANARGRVIDLVIPIVTLIICCVIGMLYTGDFFEGVDFVTAFSNSVASEGLVLGSSCALVITIILYVARRVLSFKDCMSCLPEGFKAVSYTHLDVYKRQLFICLPA